MKRIVSLVLVLLCLCGIASAETVITPLPIADVACPVPPEANFTEDGYDDASLTVRMERIEAYGSIFNVARIKVADASQLRTAVVKKANKISTIARNHNAVVAIGGDYFNDRKKGYVVRMGEVIRSKNPFKTLDMLLIDANGDFHILTRMKVNDAFEDELQALVQGEVAMVNVFNFGPALVKDGELQDIPKDYDFHLFGIEPRCAIGQTGPLEYMMVVVDGRRTDSPGVTVPQLAEFMAEQDCQQAYNLDGGNSALLYFHGDNYSDKTVSAERSVSDIIYVGTAIGAGD